MLNGSGRYVVNTPEIRNIGEVAEALHPDREKELIERRRGDRKDELFVSTSEKRTEECLDGSVLNPFGDHDRVIDYTG